MKDLLLAIDVGNTNIVLGVFEEDRLVESWRLATLRERTADEIGIWVAQLFEHRALDAGQVAAIVMGSVVPPLTGTFMTMAERYFGITPLNVDSSVDTGMPPVPPARHFSWALSCSSAFSRASISGLTGSPASILR